MGIYLGIDTSNYTTSVAVYNTDTGSLLHKKKLLPVKAGERGIRQSDAVFHHTQQLRELMPLLLKEVQLEWGLNNLSKLSAVGVSSQPRRIEGSYMPCFTVGLTAGQLIADTFGVPCCSFSHQEGHIAAALYSADRLSYFGNEFLGFHVSGGTTESLIVKPTEDCIISASIIGTSSDLKAGQAIDRVGVMLGLDFPCGAQLEKLALQSDKNFKLKPSISNNSLSLSGIENKCNKMFQQGESKEDIALFCLKSIEAGINYLVDDAVSKYPGLAIIFSGGVMSDKIIRESLIRKYNCDFAEPEFSCDNAAGIAILASNKHNRLNEG